MKNKAIFTITFILISSTLTSATRNPNSITDFNIPGWGNIGGGYGSGYGGPGGGYTHGGVKQPSTVCMEKGPCYRKKLLCPAKCFSSYSSSGRNYGGGGGGGGCTVDCKKKCVAYC